MIGLPVMRATSVVSGGDRAPRRTHGGGTCLPEKSPSETRGGLSSHQPKSEQKLGAGLLSQTRITASG